MKDYLKELNPAQTQAVCEYEGASLVIAGAGSGKTRVLTYRIVHLLENNVPPYKILALTFTNKAAKEMKERIEKIVSQHRSKYLWMGTFHSIFARILRYEAEHIGFKSNYTIYDTIDSKTLLKGIIKELKLDDKTYKIPAILGKISWAKNNLITPKAYAANARLLGIDRNTNIPEFARIYAIYSNRCFHSSAMDFDDLLLYTNVLFNKHPNILKKYQEQFHYILVDEYQDTNYSQYVIIKNLSAAHGNICVVGDDAQSIYSFRGAKIENILNFRNDYPNYKIFKLEQNYRSTQNIVNAANSVIAKNKNRIPKTIFSENEAGIKIAIHETNTDVEEGYVVANSIIDTRLGEQNDYKDYAILYRTNAQSRIFEESLRKRNIPYQIFGGISFYQRKEIKDILAYCRLVVNKTDDEALKRIINYPKRGIGNITIDKMQALASRNQLSLWETIQNRELMLQVVTRGTVSKMLKFVQLITDFTNLLAATDAYNLVSQIAVTTGMKKELYQDKTPEGISRYENLEELLNGIKEFTTQEDIPPEELTLDRFMQEISLLTNEDINSEEDKNRVSLMTVHAAKGLEFKNVYVVGLEENLFPSYMSNQSAEQLEEERRLFYVAMTRAEKRLVLSYSRNRYKWGTPQMTVKSRFLKDIDFKYVDYVDSLADAFRSKYSFKRKKPQPQKFASQNSIFNEFDSTKKQEANTPSLNRNENASLHKKTTETADTKENKLQKTKTKFCVGAKVEHPKFGTGTILQMEGNVPNTKAIIDFGSNGKKTILLKFAKLKLL